MRYVWLSHRDLFRDYNIKYIVLYMSTVFYIYCAILVAYLRCTVVQL